VRRIQIVTWVCCIALLFCGLTAVAQTITGSIRGTVTDPSGAVVAGANVTATNVATGVATQTVSDRSGLYNFQFLTLGNYTITATASGFNTTSIGPFSLQIDQIAKVDAKLSVGTASSTVKVAAGAGAILNTENATLGTSISANQLQTMPLPGQNVLYATLFVPGALNPTANTMASAYRVSPESVGPWDQIPSFNGTRQQGNNFVLDGIEINETTQNTNGYSPSPFSLQETRIITGNADAEYGNVDGAEILMVTKSGTNRFHGNAYEYFENQNLAANSWTNNYNRVAKGKYNQHQFGGQVGGPIFKNKLFFFADYSGLRYSNSTEALASVPSLLERTGNFEEANAIEGDPIFDTDNGLNTTVPYPNYTIPAIVNPVAVYLFAHPELLPEPNRMPQGGTVSTSNYGTPQTTHQINDQGDGRLDYTLSGHDTLMVKGSYGDAHDYPSNPVVPVQFPLTDNYPFAMGVIDWVHTFSPSLVNEARAGYSRIVAQTETSDPSGVFGTNGDALLSIGYPGTQPLPGFTLMNLEDSDNNSFGTPESAATTTTDNNFDYGDDVTWVHGKHITRAGVQFIRYQENYFAPSNLGGLNGQMSFTSQYTANYGSQGPTGLYSNGDGLADFELNKAQVAQVASATGGFGARQWRDAYYVQDDWKVLPNLTVNLGLRYAYDQPMYEAHNKMSTINLPNAFFAPVGPNGPDPTPYLELAGQNGNSRALINPYYYQFMPRVGFAAQLNPRTVLRGGYSITDDSEGTGTGLRMTQNPPFLLSATNIQAGPTNTTNGNPIPVQTGLIAGLNGAAPSAQFAVWDPNFRPAAVQQFNLTTQFLLASKTSLQIGYVGQVGQHIAEPRLLNQYIGPVPATCVATDTTGCVDLVAPYYAVVGGNSQIVETVSEGTSNYNALQTTLRQQETNGLEYTLNYTWSRSMTDTPGGFFNVDGVGDSGGFPFAQNAYDPHAEYGPSNFNAPNNFSGLVAYQLPFGHDKKYGGNWNRLTDEALGGWELSANAMFHSGFPLTIVDTYSSGLNASADNSNYNYAFRANQYTKMKIANQSALHWFGTDPSAIPCTTAGDTINSLGAACAYGQPVTSGSSPTGAGMFGTAHNGTERGPDFKDVDLSLFKGFRTFGEQYLKFRVDAYNAFNIVSLGYPNTRVGSSNFGKITSANSNPRQFQISGVYTF
jgi:hypothetical protein